MKPRASQAALGPPGITPLSSAYKSVKSCPQPKAGPMCLFHRYRLPFRKEDVRGVTHSKGTYLLACTPPGLSSLSKGYFNVRSTPGSPLIIGVVCLFSHACQSVKEISEEIPIPGRPIGSSLASGCGTERDHMKKLLNIYPDHLCLD